MATVRLTYTWADGDALDVVVRVAASYPDALAEAKVTALGLYASALDTTTTTHEGDE